MCRLLGRYNSMSLPLKSAIWFVISNVCLKGIAFFTAPVFAYLLSADEYGRLSVFAAYEQILAIIITWEVGYSPFQRGLIKFEGTKDQFRSSVILFSVLTALGGIIFLGLFRESVIHYTKMPFWLIVVIMVHAMTSTAYLSWMSESKLEYNYRTVSIMTVIVAVLQTVFALYAVCEMRAVAEYKMLYAILPALTINLVIWARRFSIVDLVQQWKTTLEHIKYLVSFTWPLAVNALAYLVLGQVDRVMIGGMIGEVEAGIYSVSYTIASVVVFVQNAALQAVIPWIYQQMDSRNYDAIKARTASLVGLISGCYIVFVLIAPDILLIMYPPVYWDGIMCIPPITLGVFFMFLYSFFVAIEECLDKTIYIAIVSVFCATLNIVLNYYGIIWFGYSACAYTTLLCYALFAVGHYFFMNRVLRIEMKGVRIYDGKLFFYITIWMICTFGGVLSIYSNSLLRHVVVCVLIVGCMIYRDRIQAVIEQIS